MFGTAGKKAGARLRHKLGKNKQAEVEDNPKPISPTSSSSSLPPSPRNDEMDDQGRKLLLKIIYDSSSTEYNKNKIPGKNFLKVVKLS
jgi:hypothetical protein